MFDVKTFLDQHEIPYVTKGPNTKKGNVSIQCPFCGPLDHSQHMGIRLRDGAWGCWRDAAHRGRDPTRLIQALIGCTWMEAKAIAGRKVFKEDAFDKLAAGDWSDETKEHKSEGVARLDMPREFRHLLRKSHSGAGWAYVQSLLQRKFGYKDIDLLHNLYDLRFAVTGDYAKRIIFPYYMQGQLVTWSGRSISMNASLRYRARPAELSVVPTKETLYNLDNAQEGGKVLLVVEGPFDTIKMDYVAYCYNWPAHAVGLSSMSIEDSQMYLLQDLASRYDLVVGMVDAGEAVAAGRLQDKLGFLRNLSVMQTPYAEDPGALALSYANIVIGELCEQKT